MDGKLLSFNRGRCAQPCRMRYDLLEDGKVISSDNFAISTKDLMTIDNLDEFIDAYLKQKAG